MGRAKRTRTRKKRTKNEDIFTDDIDHMTKWMATYEWKNVAKVKCREFEQLGRGVTSSKSITCGDVLIKVPYNLLITYSTTTDSEEFMHLFKFSSKLRIQELLSVFLIIEKHKDGKSHWKYYIASLPKNEPKLPWFSSLEEIQCYPEEFRSICQKCRYNFQESWIRLINSINSNWTCSCCNKKIDEIFNLETYIWGYTMVNTRGVYVDPDLVKNFSKCDNILLDEPNIALCPLMDMFNHSDTSEVRTELKHTAEDTLYELITFQNFRKNDQIFISYGRHDNLKLFAEYGFFLQQNSNDKIKFKPDEILKVLNLKLSNYQYGFLKKNQFLNRDELFISCEGVSFKLKSFLYVACNDGEKNYSVYIFGENYDENFTEILKYFLAKLIQYKIKEYKYDVDKISEKFCKTNILNFLNNRRKFVENLEELIDDFY